MWSLHNLACDPLHWPTLRLEASLGLPIDRLLRRQVAMGGANTHSLALRQIGQKDRGKQTSHHNTIANPMNRQRSLLAIASDSLVVAKRSQEPQVSTISQPISFPPRLSLPLLLLGCWGAPQQCGWEATQVRSPPHQSSH